MELAEKLFLHLKILDLMMEVKKVKEATKLNVKIYATNEVSELYQKLGYDINKTDEDVIIDNFKNLVDSVGGIEEASEIIFKYQKNKKN